jgi:hypothetical protein
MYILAHQVKLSLRLIHIVSLEEKSLITLTLLRQRKPVLVVAFQISKILTFLYPYYGTRNMGCV